MLEHQASIEDNRAWWFNGRLYKGKPEPTKLPQELQYKDPLSYYEIVNYNVINKHKLCFRCYEKLHNTARFGLCVMCYNDDSTFKRIIAVDAKNHRLYLSRRGSKIKLVGGMIKVPIRDGRSVIDYKRILYRPYIDVNRENIIPLEVDPSGTTKCHGIIPMEYVLAELD